MMRIILLLLVTLTGPFCTFTQASTLPPTISSGSISGTQNFTEKPAVNEKEETSPPVYSTQQVTVDTEKIPDTTIQVTVASTQAQMVTSIPAIKISTKLSELKKNVTEETNTTTDATEAPFLVTNTSTELKRETAMKDENEKPDGDGVTGQVVGIVIGALIGVIVVIAIIILVVRRMGQYSPAKKRKPQKQESILISPLKRKARQEEKKKKSGKF